MITDHDPNKNTEYLLQNRQINHTFVYTFFYYFYIRTFNLHSYRSKVHVFKRHKDLYSSDQRMHWGVFYSSSELTTTTTYTTTTSSSTTSSFSSTTTTFL